MNSALEELMADKMLHAMSEPHNFQPAKEPPPPEELEMFADAKTAPIGPVNKELLTERAIEALKTVYDPEMPVNIYDLGLIYGIEIDDEAVAHVTMTLTAPGCPVADEIVRQATEAVSTATGVKRSHVKLTWDPPWTSKRMTEAAMLELGLL